MNTVIQNILAFSTLAFALGYLVKKWFWNPTPAKTKKACGQDKCGCH
ncbi:FeoB-associated Cys-rich membrane protein [Mangrovimonas aestuarii]|nr:FeoB-associated Cys-rich membrane protein [Mangrovimonas aestuarii]